MRALPVVLAQVPAREPAAALDGLREELLYLTDDFPATRLVLYPEYHTCPAVGAPDERRKQYEALAEPLDGPRVERLQAIAAEVGVWLIPGTLIERGENGGLYNTAIAVSPDGEVVATYRKIFPWRPFEPFDSGGGFAVFDIPDVGRIGLSICYDLWFPEVARQLAWMGADVVVSPAQTSTIDRAQELVLARATAIANQVFFLGVNAAEPSGVGQSIIADPEGLVRVAAPSESSTYLTDVLDLEAVDRVRTYGTCGLNRIWSQLHDDDPVLDLPVYDGSIHPRRWRPAPRPLAENDHE